MGGETVPRVRRAQHAGHAPATNTGPSAPTCHWLPPEVADLTRPPYGRVAVRDSKEPSGPAFLIKPEGWTTFVAAVAHEVFPA